ncbi:MAG: methyltransferase domain-containing protein [Candidatus Eisenbacteria bacterium]|nr:methyltransferase domain-containing protein [Candidatus Eisenbacteria bacterium]
MTTHREKRARAAGVAPFLLAVLLGIAPVPGAAQDVPPDPLDECVRLAPLFREAVDAGEWTLALETGEEMAWQAMTLHTDLLFEIARQHALLGEPAEAYLWLDRARAAGFWDVMRVREDEAFANLITEDHFRALLRGIWLNGYIAMLERDERDDFQMPARVMETLALEPGERVADVGAGSGYFTIPVAKAVGPEGVVWAMDIRQEMLDFLEKRLRGEKIENVRVRLVEPDDPGLPPGGVDTILMVDTWHYIRDPAYAAKLRAGLAPGGRVVVIDYRPKPWEERPWGVPPQQQTPREELDAHFAEAGLQPVRVHDFLPEQYFVEYEAR